MVVPAFCKRRRFWRGWTQRCRPSQAPRKLADPMGGNATLNRRVGHSTCKNLGNATSYKFRRKWATQHILFTCMTTVSHPSGQLSLSPSPRTISPPTTRISLAFLTHDSGTPIPKVEGNFSLACSGCIAKKAGQVARLTVGQQEWQ